MQGITKKGKGSPYSITERRVPGLIQVLGSRHAADVSHKPGGRLPLLSATPAVTFATLKRAATSFAAWWTEARRVWTVCLTRQRCGCDLNPGPSAPESSTLTTRLPSHPQRIRLHIKTKQWIYLVRFARNFKRAECASVGRRRMSKDDVWGFAE